jgi:Family of unknown function (DUF5988)
MLEPVPAPPLDSPSPPVTVVLEGGPETLPAELRQHSVPATVAVLKVAHCGGYEHFERDGTDVFRWTQRTLVAE